MFHIALLGFGTVGSGVDAVIRENSEKISRRLGDTLEVKRILDLREFPDPRVTHDYDTILNDPEISVVCEMMGGVHPAYEFTVKALEAGKSVVTSNKAVVAAFGPELLALAKEKNLSYAFEASVGGAIPIIRGITESMAGEEILGIDGILNGTTNFILTEMTEKGVSYEGALKEAQKRGFAEADPTADVAGHDACRKICILAALVTGKLIPFESVSCEGIDGITEEDIRAAEEKGAKLRLVASFRKIGDKFHLSVAPYAVPTSHPLYHVSGVENAVIVYGKESSRLTFEGPGAGSRPTASAVTADIIDLCLHQSRPLPITVWERDESDFLRDLPEECTAETEGTLGIPVSALRLAR